jgi:hypothetical protein
VRGSPLLRAVLAFVVILFMGLPLWKLTGERPLNATLPVTPVTKESGIHRIPIQLTFTRPPAALQVLHLGQEIWSETSPAFEMERTVELDFPRAGIELLFRIRWPEEGPSAMRVRLTGPDGAEYDKTVWGQGDTEEVVGFP